MVFTLEFVCWCSHCDRDLDPYQPGGCPSVNYIAELAWVGFVVALAEFTVVISFSPTIRVVQMVGPTLAACLLQTFHYHHDDLHEYNTRGYEFNPREPRGMQVTEGCPGLQVPKLFQSTSANAQNLWRTQRTLNT